MASSTVAAFAAAAVVVIVVICSCETKVGVGLLCFVVRHFLSFLMVLRKKVLEFSSLFGFVFVNGFGYIGRCLFGTLLEVWNVDLSNLFFPEMNELV